MADPLVSILIPAYNERHFGEAFASACTQQGVDLEIVVCDDSPGEAIGTIVALATAASAMPGPPRSPAATVRPT